VNFKIKPKNPPKMYKKKSSWLCNQHTCCPNKFFVAMKFVIVSLTVAFFQTASASVNKNINLDLKSATVKDVIKTGEIKSINVKGQVTDEKGSPLPGVSVIKKGTTSGTLTDVNGNFSLMNLGENETLVFSFVGMKSQEVAVNGRKNIIVVLQTESISMDELVVIGYGTAKRSDLTGALVSISSKDFEKQPLNNVAQALQGRAAGVQVTQTSGAPGGGFKIRIRGANSITGGNEPLYVVDGQFVDISAVNINDIASMEVLKDASATAIYGTRGANGVVLITTKKGTKGVTKISADLFTGFSNVTQKLDLMSAAEFAEGVDFAEGVNPNVANPFYTTAEIEALRISGGEDWQKLLFQTAYTNNAQLSASGGSESLDYYISGNLYQTTGTVVDQKFRRLNLRSNFNGKLTEKVKIGINYNMGREELNGVRADLGAGLSFDPTTPAFKADGTYNFNSIKNVATSEVNPLIAVQNNSSKNITDRFNVDSYLNYQITKNLVFNTSVGVIRSEKHINNYAPIITSSIGIANVDDIYLTNLFNTNRLTYSLDINKNNNLKIDAIHELVREKYNIAKINASNFFTDLVSYKDLSLAAIQRTSNSEANRDLESFLGRVNYSLNNKYLLTASLRADGTSVFQNNKWGYFPSASLAWKVSEEKFMKKIEAIDNLKVRLSYGQVGNQGIGVYGTRSRAVISPGINYPFNGIYTTGVAPSNRVANPDLTWEKTAQLNSGFDLGILNSAITLSVDYYKKNTRDLLLDTQLPAFVGPTRKFVNAGEVENKGFEITLGARVLKNDSWSINSSLSVSRNKNKVLSLFDNIKSLEVGDDVRANTYPVKPTRVEVGMPISTFRGYVFEGVYQTGATDGTPGQAKYKDVSGPNGVPDGLITSDDITTIGDGNAAFTWGWNWDVSYKKLNLNFLVTGSQGNDIYNLQRARLMGLGAQQFHAVYGDYRDRWTPTNPSNIPSSRNGTQNLSSQFVEDGSYINMKSIALSYNLDNKLLKKIGLSNFRLYTSVENLFIITKYSGFNPESSASPVSINNQDADVGIDYNSYPINRSVTFGLNASF
jgi:TonB-linked SusC/RagA family outer membrane protein